MLRNFTPEELKEKSRRLRVNILKMITEAGSGHPGGSLSSIDILTVLYNNVLRHDPSNPHWPGRDRFILSKGHVCPALYAILADCGYFDESELGTLRKYGSILQGHPYMYKTPGLEVSSGSLGQGLSVAVGLSLGAKMDNGGFRVFCLMGDGETQEGQIWEAAMAAGHYRLNNLCGIVDFNGLQIDGKVEEVMSLEPYRDKWRAFEWNMIEIDGHDFQSLLEAFKKAEECMERPTVIIARTIKGKGVSFMENNPAWHGVAPNRAQLEAALEELSV